MAEYKYRVIDNFLSPYLFNKLVYETNPLVDYKKNDSMKWGYCKTVRDAPESLGDVMYFENLIYCNTIMNEKYFKVLNEIIDKLEVRSLMRIKLNLYTRTESLCHHPDHCDTSFSHKGGVFSLNTCDGYTKFSDGTKSESIANRIVFFDASKEHSSTTTSNAKLRYNINFNFI